jgi:hypothetical protein
MEPGSPRSGPGEGDIDPPSAPVKAKRKERASEVEAEASVPLTPANRPPAPSDRLPLKALNPAGGTFEVYVTRKRAEWAARGGKGALLEIQHTVAAVLADPDHVYEGIRWEEDEDRDKADKVDSWLCYCGSPDSYYKPNNTTPRPSSPDHVFLIFVNHDRVAYNWRWERADGVDDGCPNGHVTRFHRKRL